MNRILTIGIPTYNRASTLILMLNQLVIDVGMLAPRVEVIISDNCSQDGTQDVITSWIENAPKDLSIRSVRNDVNIGVSRNILSLVYLAETPFFSFLGDDDRINGSEFVKLIDIIGGESPPSAVIQALWEGKIRGGATGYVGYEQAVHLFYEYGNAWAGIIDTKAAINAIESRGLRAELEKIVWPQTVMGYLAMYDLPNRKVYLADFEIGMRLVSPLNITNKLYWVRGLYGLLKAASLIENCTSDFRVANVFLRSTGFYEHIRAILVYSLINGSDFNTSEVQYLLRNCNSLNGFFWSLVMKFSHYPNLLEWGMKWCYVALQGRYTAKTEFESKLAVFRLQHQWEVAQISNSNKRFGDWY